MTKQEAQAQRQARREAYELTRYWRNPDRIAVEFKPRKEKEK